MKKSKLIPILSLATILSGSACMFSCNKKQEQEIDYTQDVIDEFMGNGKDIDGLTSVPRPGYYHDKIIPYLKQRVKTISDLQDKDIHVDGAGNIYFDIPGSKGYEDKDMIIIQGHTDMVVAGMSEGDAKTKPIDAVIDGNEIHSKDYKTSIGADDGIGVASALAILKHRNDFNHGPIRFLLTADEDVGMVGASMLNPSWLKYNNNPIKWLLNIDAEALGTIYRSCAGNARMELSQSYEEGGEIESNETPTYCFNLDGLTGGHSAFEILNHKANADKLVYEFLWAINNTFGDKVTIYSQDHTKIVSGNEVDISYSKNQIIANSRVIFKAGDLLPNQINKVLEDLWEFWKNTYTGENWDEIEAKSWLNSRAEIEPLTPRLDDSESANVINLIGAPNDDKDAQHLTHLYYGPYTMIDADHPEASSNIGPVSIKYKKPVVEGNPGYIDVNIGLSTRSHIGNKTSQEKHSINWAREEMSNVARNFEFNYKDDSCYYPWPKNENNKIVQIFKEGYESLGVKPNIVDDNAGVEPAWWMDKSDGKITCACVGVEIHNAHSVNETAYIDSINPVVQNVVYALKELIK